MTCPTGCHVSKGYVSADIIRAMTASKGKQKSAAHESARKASKPVLNVLCQINIAHKPAPAENVQAVPQGSLCKTSAENALVFNLSWKACGNCLFLPVFHAIPRKTAFKTVSAILHIEFPFPLASPHKPVKRLVCACLCFVVSKRGKVEISAYKRLNTCFKGEKNNEKGKQERL